MPTARITTLTAIAISFGLLLWKPLLDPVPTLIWNVSSSVPIGLYLVEKRLPMRREIGVLRLPDRAALIASERRYLPRGVWLLKPVAATKHDVVCRFGAKIFINGRHVARALRTDKKHRPMPAWKGCRRLKSNQFFLLSTHRDSFDSRYFSPVDGALVVGTAKPILLLDQ